MKQYEDHVVRILRISSMGMEPTYEHRKLRGEILASMYMGVEGVEEDGKVVCWNLYNANADQELDLKNLETKIMETDAFLYMPNPSVQDMVSAASVFVGYQTGDKHLDGKPTVVLNPQGSWNGFLTLIDHLHDMGTVKQSRESLFTVIEEADPYVIAKALNDTSMETQLVRTHYNVSDVPNPSVLDTKSRPDFNVCVFCSSATTDEGFIELGKALGKAHAEKGWGTISGAGRTGIMGAVVDGASGAGGWTGGSNVPHIIAIEGLPDGLHDFWPRPDIYSRMEVMIKKSQSFVILPGGMGSVQEALALLILKEREHEIMKHKPIIIVNLKVDGEGFWTPLIDIIEEQKLSHLVTVLDVEHDNAVETIVHAISDAKLDSEYDAKHPKN